MKRLSLSLRLVIVIIFAAAAAAAAIGANAAGYRPLDSVQEFLGIAPPSPITAPAKAENAAATAAPMLPAATTLLTDDFDYSGLLTANGWTAHSSSGSSALSTTTGLSYSGYPNSGAGNAVLIGSNGGEDDNRGLSSTINTNGSQTYYSCLVNVNDANTSKGGDYFLMLGNRSSPTSFSSFAARVFARIVSGNVNFGLNNTANATWGTTNFSRNTTYLLIVKYTINTSGNDSTQLWVIPSGVPATESSAGTPEVTDSGTAGQDSINALALRQGALSQPQLILDGIRVATTWVDLFPPPTVNLSVSTNSASETGQTAVTVTATASSAVSGNQTVSLGVSGTGITAGDYTLSNTTITIPNGQTAGSVTFTVVDDDVYEVPEIATLTISNPSAGITLGTTVSQDVTITDNDNAPNVHFTAAHFAGSEGGVQISIDRSGAPGNDFFVDLNSGSGGGMTCSTGTDYIAPNSQLHFVAGETNKTFTVQFCADLIYEGNESFDIYLVNPTGGAFVGAQNFAFMDAADNDTKPTFDISTAATSVDEGVGTLTITVNRTGAPGNDVSVDLGVGGGTATIGASCTAGVDYVGGGQHLLFPPGTTSVPYNITICNDAVTEPAETFTATLSNPQNPAAAQLGTTTTETVTINASDGGAPVVYVDSAWAGTTIGDDPDGAGPATSFGTDSFATIAEGIAGVADNGELIINPGTYGGDMRVDHPSLIKGKFAITGELQAQVAGVKVSPGQSPGIITSGSLVLTSGSELDIELNGTNPGTGHDQMNVTAGPVDLGGATLVLSALGGYRPAIGNQFTIINNQGAGAVIGTFAGLAEGDPVSDGTSSYTISYTGGDGNDVVLTATSGGCGNVVSIPAVTSPTGVSATVPVNTTDLTGQNVIAADFTVTYDPAVLNPATINVTAGAAASPGATVTFNATVPGTIVISVYNGTVGGSFTGPGPLVNITADVIGTAGSAGSFTVTGGGFNGGLVCSSSTGGTIDVVPATTATTVATSGSPSTYGDVVTFTATVTAATPTLGTPVTSGSVEFYDGACGVGTPFFTGMPDGSGQVTAPISSLTAGSHTISACYLANTDFIASSGTVGQTVNPATPVITVTGSNTFTYNGSPQGPDTADTGGSTSVPTFSYSGTTNGAVPYGPSATKPTLAGSYTVTASVVADANYTAASSAPFAFTIGRATPTVTVTGSTTFTYNGSPQGPNAATTGGSTGALSFSYEGTPNGGGTYGPSATPPTNAGNYTVTASVAQDDNYSAASSTATPFTIDRATPTLSVTNSPVAFDGNPHSAAVSATVPGVVSNILTGGLATQTTIGVYAVTADFAPTDANNYNSLIGASAGNFEILTATTIVERPGTTNWFYYDDFANAIIPGHDFVAGPGSPPLQSGSARFLSSGSMLKALGTQMFNGTRLADISTLRYQTYVQGGFEAAGAPMIQFNVDFDLTTADTDYQGRVVYVPSQNGTVTAGTWQTWDTLDGVFWYSDFVPLPTRSECTPAAPCTKAQMLALHPNMGIHAGQIGGLLFRAQNDSNANVDDLTIGVTAPNAVKIFDFEQATSTVTVNCPNASYEYTGSAIAPCTASYTTSDGLTASLAVNYTANTDVTPVVTASATYPGDDNHAGSTGSDTFAITPAASSTVIDCSPGTFEYTGSAISPCTATVTGVGGLSTTVPVTYGNNLNVGTATADASYGGDANHSGSTAAQATFDITKAPSTVTVDPLSVEYDGNPHTTTFTVSGVGTGITQSVTWAYTGACSAAPVNVLDTPCTATATYAGDSNHLGNSGFNTITITKAPSTTTLTFESGPYVYRGTAFQATASVDGTGTTGFSSSVAPVYSGDCLNVTAANGCTATATYAGDNNHTGSSDIKSITITKKTLVITPDPQTVLYGTADPAFTFGYSGFVLPEGPGNLATLPVCSVPGSSPHAPGTYTISCVAGTAVNYDFDVTATANFLVNSGSIAGSVNYLIDPKPVPNVKLDALGSSSFFGTTSVSGTYLLNGFGAGAYTVTPSRTAESCGGTNGVQASDATLIAQYVVGLAPLTADQKLAADVSGGPTPTISSFDAALVAQRVVCLANPINVAGQWKFTPANHTYSSGVTANLTGEDFNAYLLGDVDGNWNPAGTSRPELLSQPTKDSINVSVPALTASAGSVVTVPFRVENLGGRPVGAYQFDIEYDPAVISPADIAADLEGTLGSNLSVVYNSPEPGRLKIAVYGALPATGDGTYVNLRFNVIGGAGSATPMNITNLVINDGTEQVYASSGSLTVAASANNGMLRGRLLSATGRPVGNARVTVTNTMSSLRSAVTNPFGLFEFSNLGVGETYTVTVDSKRYTFTPRTVSITDGVVDLDMIAEQ